MEREFFEGEEVADLLQVQELLVVCQDFEEVYVLYDGDVFDGHDLNWIRAYLVVVFFQFVELQVDLGLVFLLNHKRDCLREDHV